MIHFRCGQCARWVGASDADAGRSVRCRTCGHDNRCPAHESSSSRSVVPRAPGRRGATLLAMGGAAVAMLGGVLWHMAWSPAAAPAAGLMPVSQRQQDLVAENVGRAGDAELLALFASINSRHFRGGLPNIPVRWEPKLGEAGRLADEAFRLEGL